MTSRMVYCTSRQAPSIELRRLLPSVNGLLQEVSLLGGRAQINVKPYGAYLIVARAPSRISFWALGVVDLSHIHSSLTIVYTDSILGDHCRSGYAVFDTPGRPCWNGCVLKVEAIVHK